MCVNCNLWLPVKSSTVADFGIPLPPDGQQVLMTHRHVVAALQRTDKLNEGVYELPVLDDYFENDGLKALNFTNVARYDYDISCVVAKDDQGGAYREGYAYGTIRLKPKPPPPRRVPDGYNVSGVCYLESRRIQALLQEIPELVNLVQNRILAGWELALPQDEIVRRVKARLQEIKWRRETRVGRLYTFFQHWWRRFRSWITWWPCKAPPTSVPFSAMHGPVRHTTTVA